MWSPYGESYGYTLWLSEGPDSVTLTSITWGWAVWVVKK
jgi:hypothetical protein